MHPLYESTWALNTWYYNAVTLGLVDDTKENQGSISCCVTALPEYFSFGHLYPAPGCTVHI